MCDRQTGIFDSIVRAMHTRRAVKKTAILTRSSAIAETARVTIRSVIALDQLTVTITLNMS